MKLTDQVISRELAKRLNDLWIPQKEAAFYWIEDHRHQPRKDGTYGGRLVSRGKLAQILSRHVRYWAAFTVPELGEMLIKANEHLPYYNGHQYECRVPAPECEDGKKYILGPTEAEARGRMIAHLKQRNFI